MAIRHVIWTVDPSRSRGASSRRSRALPALYIADGHHRAASAARARRALAGRGSGEHDRVLAVAFPDDQMQILPYNRVVQDLNGTDAGAVSRADPAVTCRSPKPRRRRPRRKGSRDDVSRRAAGMRSISAPVTPPDGGTAALDVSVLQDAILDAVLGIKDVRTDKRIDFVGGIRGDVRAEAAGRLGHVCGGVFALSGHHSAI